MGEAPREAISTCSLVHALTKRSARALLAQLAPRSRPLRDHLWQRLDQQPGDEASFLADPVIEATFGWRQAGVTMRELAGGQLEPRLEPRLVEAMDRPPKKLEEFRFEAVWQPYTHQLEAWRRLAETPPRSVLVSSGTGSGKTECFLVPILNDLVGLSRTEGALQGVRALFLYPLNALINSQRDRLLAWTSAFGGDLRFCLYNGETPEHPGREKPPASEVRDRKSLREDPPPVLVTNATMLEYMLVRRVDAPILECSQGRLRWIVVDEAHTYIGSQAAELSLLLRRVLHAFGVEPGEVRFVATSATIASQERDDVQEQLRTYLANLAGVDPSRVDVIAGERSVPAIAPELAARDEPLPSFDELRELDPVDRYQVLASHRGIREMRRRLVEGPRRLSGLRRTFARYVGTVCEQRMQELLDLCATARSCAENEAPDLLPFRLHLFHRASRGLWACCNPRCHVRGPFLEDPAWPFGQVYLDRRERCACGGRVFELVLCGGCGSEYLAAEQERSERGPGAYRLVPRNYESDEDEEYVEDLLENEEDEEGRDPSAHKSGDKAKMLRLITGPGLSPGVETARVDVESGDLLDRSGPGQALGLIMPDEAERTRCPRCGDREKESGGQFRPARLGAPFFLGVAIPTLLEHVPPSANGTGPLPYGGRRLITFSDSRQGTARFALRVQQDAERNHVRSLLYHGVLASRAKPGDVDLDALRQQVALLEKAPGLETVLEEKRRELAEAEVPAVGRLSWKKAAEEIHHDNAVGRWLPELWEEQTYGKVPRDELREFCVLRELLRRPKRANSLETLGLLALDYPKLRQSPPPAAWKARSLPESDWHDYLTLLVDYLVRSRTCVQVPPGFLRWMGAEVRTRYLLSPSEDTDGDKKLVRWPYLQGGAVRHRMIHILVRGLDLDLGDRDDRAWIHEVLDEAWTGVYRLLRPAADRGYLLHLDKEAELVEVHEAWFCPVTRRILPIAFRGVTPYLKFNSPSPDRDRCEAVRMPRLPTDAFWRDRSTGRRWSSEEALGWLETDEDVRNLRQLGAWSDLSDRIVAVTEYFRTAEHSAQQNSRRLRSLEDDLKAGRVNILSCSTTMEMGVDIGGLSMVAMNNTPPSPANFLQRAGRAGRRQEPVSVSFTLCKSTPHGEAVFKQPLWPFVTELFVPRVSLESARIVQRHVHATLLSRFLMDTAEDDLPKLTAEGFFEPRTEDVEKPTTGDTPAEAFQSWCHASTALGDATYRRGLSSLRHGTVLEEQPAEELLNRAAGQIAELQDQYLTETRALLRDLETFGSGQAAKKAQDTKKTPAELAIGRQLRRQRGEYLLGELAARGFLPGYGFPTNVVPFIPTTLEQLRWEEARRRREEEEGKQREDNRWQRRGYPSRDLAIAIRDYAPGSEVVLDGRIYRSEGVTLNWRVPPGDEPVQETQAFRVAWRCRVCGNGDSSSRKPDRCPSCSNEKLRVQYYLRPSGFAVGITYEPHNNAGRQVWVPVEEPWITAGDASWQNLPEARLGRYRYSPDGRLFHYSRGISRYGFAICLHCGRAASEISKERDGPLPKALVEHRRLRGGKEKDGKTYCSGNDTEYGIKRHYALGVETHTDVFELQLRDPRTGSLVAREAAYSIAVALREGLAGLLGIDPRELGCAAVPSHGEEMAGSGCSIVLFDTATGGAGFVAAAAENLAELFAAARGRLECPRDCDRACQACLLTYDSQHQIKYLDRHQALAALHEELAEALATALGEQAVSRNFRLAGLEERLRSSDDPVDALSLSLLGTLARRHRLTFADALTLAAEKGFSETEAFAAVERLARPETAGLRRYYIDRSVDPPRLITPGEVQDRVVEHWNEEGLEEWMSGVEVAWAESGEKAMGRGEAS